MKITVGLVARAGTSWANKTGSWRTGIVPKFLRQKCNACDLCALACPDGCIYGEAAKDYHADMEFCKGCGICAKVCPVKDIVMEPEVR